MTSLTTRGRFAPITEVCPDCKGEMTVIEVRPLRFIDGVESITYDTSGQASARQGM